MSTLLLIDFNKTLYNPLTQALFDDVESTLNALQQNHYKLVLISIDSEQKKEIVSSLGITDYFEEVIFTDEKTVALFKSVVKKHNNQAATTIVIGDTYQDELTSAAMLGLEAIAIAPNKVLDLKTYPSFVEACNEELL